MAITKHVQDGLLQAIGHTPLIRIQGLSRAALFAKLEYLNPGGSIKDRTALFMVEEAERSGALRPHGTIVEASSGNQGIALAMIGAHRGYRVIICCPQRTSQEKIATLRAYGAEVHVCPNVEEIDDPKSYHGLARRLTQELKAFCPNQYFNPVNAEAHYHTTGPEIWEQTEGQVTHCMIGMGTCGAITGIGRFLKQKNSKIQVLGADAAHSWLSTGGDPQLYQAEGIGVDGPSENLDCSVIDQIFPIQDEEAFQHARMMAKMGYLVGISSGAVMAAAMKVLPTLPDNAQVVLIFADSGRAYLSKLYPSA